MELGEILSGSRGQVAAEVRAGRGTVGEIAEALGMTRNNVRAHISSLQRDGVVQIAGSRPGFRKPTTVYSLTPGAESLFARAYEPVLVELAAVMSEHGADLRKLFREVGRRLSSGLGPLSHLPLSERLTVLAQAFRSLGAAPVIELEGGQLTVRGPRCPLAKVVAVTPEACEVALTLVETATGLQVEERCLHGAQPSCCFVARLAS